MSRLWTIVLALLIGVTAASTAVAQNQFSPVIRVGNDVITLYQVTQRTRFLALLGAPGDPRDVARQQLINEAIQLQAASDAGLTPSPEAITAGLEEFAGRANLTAEQFLIALSQNGVDGQTFRDFVTAGVAWRSYVRSELTEDARDGIPRESVRRTLSRTGTEGGLRVLISEIILPGGSEQTKAASQARATTLAALDGEDAFAAAARTFSIAPTASRGGELQWRAIETLPEEIAATVRGLQTGQISRPIDLGNSIGLFLLHDSEQVAPGAPGALAVDYALFITNGGPAEAASVAARVDVCDDLYGVAKGLPEERLIRETSALSALPPDIQAALAGMDSQEKTTSITRGGNSTVLMLCERTAEQESTVDFEIVGTRILNQRLGAMAAHELSNLRAATRIVELQ